MKTTFEKIKRRVLISLQIRLARIWRECPFFIQGQMDIHPESPWYNHGFVRETGGFFPTIGREGREILDHDCWDGVRRDMIILLLRSLEERNVPGLFAELGVYRGGTARLIHHYTPERELHLFDTFAGFDARDATHDREVVAHEVDTTLFRDTGINLVKEAIKPKNHNVHFHQGYFPEIMSDELRFGRYAFVHLDADLYSPIIKGLEIFYPLMSSGGFLLVHDYNAWPGARDAVEEFCALQGIVPVPMPDKSGSCVLLKP